MLPDTRASVTMAGTKFMRSMGQSEANLAKCNMRLYGADNNDIQLLGVIPVIITDVVTGLQTRQIVYICNKASTLLLSLKAYEDLGYISHNFPSSHYGAASNAATLAA